MCPFLNGILLATEENQGCNRPCALPCSHSPLLHAASLCLLSLALIPCSPALLLHMHLPLLRASSQRAILPHPPPPPTLPPRPTLLYQLRHTTRTYTNSTGHTNIHTHTHMETGSSRPHLFLIMEIQSPPLPSYHLSHCIPSGAAHSRSSSTRRENENHQAEASAVQPFSA